MLNVRMKTRADRLALEAEAARRGLES
jgi:hypothetical protein